ncbi:hypothetical protein DUT91_09660 [Phyllobacterium salinisoli]|uniref:Uncharacterized protein n=2 Tax=Phyllobacterium salinisoli TaxID=1899321 RepID=A0A368K2D7_9HYPH|nr:hypothetical protein DUT91_09660 [Phyllobacterium salinisoli]
MLTFTIFLEPVMVRTASIGIRVEPVVKEALERAAKADRRSVAGYLEKLILDDLEAKGFLAQGAPE